MPAYQYKNLPLSASIAAGLVIECLSGAQKPVQRGDIITYVVDRHRKLGGTNAQDSTGCLKKALNRLIDEGRINRLVLGLCALAINESRGGADEQIGVGEPEKAKKLLTPEETIEGSGDELVYVYFNEADRKLAKHDGRNWWPCKVGFTAASLTTRILGQGLSTSMARLPTVGLVIKTDDGRGLERAIHFALDEAKMQIDDALGNEWFETSPKRILDWYRMLQQAVALLRK